MKWFVIGLVGFLSLVIGIEYWRATHCTYEFSYHAHPITICKW